MDRTEFILTGTLCEHYQVSYHFITELQEAGLIQIVTIENNQYVHYEQLKELEKLIRFHSEMNINLEGIEAVAHLLEQVDQLQHEVQSLKQRLSLYE